MDNISHFTKIDRLARTISKDPSKVRELIILMDGLVKISLSGGNLVKLLEKLEVQAMACRNFLDKHDT